MTGKHTRASRELKRRLRPSPPEMSQAALAARLGVTQQAVSAWVNGVALPKPATMAALEEMLGVPMRDWTVDDEGDESGEHPAASVPPRRSTA